MMKGMIFMLIGNFLMAWVLVHNIGAWQHVPGMIEMGKMSNTITTAIFTWLGFYVPYHLGAVVWQNTGWKLFFINVGYALVSLIVVSSILIYMD
jgi:hypothetical protein